MDIQHLINLQQANINSSDPDPFWDNPYEDPMRDEDLDFSDENFLKLEKLINLHVKLKKSPIDIKYQILWIHRWIMSEITSREIEQCVKKGMIDAIYNKHTSKETLLIQTKAAHEIESSSKLLSSRLYAKIYNSNLGIELKHAYLSITDEYKNNNRSPSLHSETTEFLEANHPANWEDFQKNLIYQLKFLQDISRQAIKTLQKKETKLGQPPKTERDEFFYKWQSFLARELDLSVDVSTFIASMSWNIYFPNQKLNEDAALKVVKRQRAQNKGKLGPQS